MVRYESDQQKHKNICIWPTETVIWTKVFDGQNYLMVIFDGQKYLMVIFDGQKLIFDPSKVFDGQNMSIKNFWPTETAIFCQTEFDRGGVNVYTHHDRRTRRWAADGHIPI